jgi:hypothetical protein
MWSRGGGDASKTPRSDHLHVPSQNGAAGPRAESVSKADDLAASYEGRRRGGMLSAGVLLLSRRMRVAPVASITPKPQASESSLRPLQSHFLSPLGFLTVVLKP